MFASRDANGLCIGIIALLLLFSSSVFSQSTYKDKITKNTFYVEILGAAPVFSFCYGRQIILSPKDKLSIDIGIEEAPFISSRFSLGVSPQISYLRGTKNHFEIGFGMFHDIYWGDYIPFPKIGFRYQKKTGGFFYKIEATPLFVYFKPIKTILPWGV